MPHWQREIFHLYRVFHLQLPEELKYFYFITILRTIIMSIVGIFFPIYLLKLTGTIYLPMMYLFFVYLGSIILNIVLTKYFIEKIGLETTMFFSYLFGMIVCYLFILFQKGLFIPIPLISLIVSLSHFTYWISYHYSFSVFGETKKLAEEQNLMKIFSSIIKIFLPVITAIAISQIGFFNFFIILSTVFTIVLILFIKKIKHRHKLSFNFENMKKVFVTPKVCIYFIIEGIGVTVPLILPFVLYLYLKDIVKYGGVLSLEIFFNGFLIYLISKIIDIKGNKKFFIGSTVLVSLTWMIIPFTSDSIIFSILYLLSSMLFMIHATTYHDIFYTLIKRKTFPEEVIPARNSLIALGRIILISIFLLCLNESLFWIPFFIGSLLNIIFIILTIKWFVKNIQV